MAKYRDEVETLITARNTATAEMRKAEDQAKAMAARERQRQREDDQIARRRAREAQGLGRELSTGLVGTALRATAAFGSLELGLKGINAVGSAIKGDWQTTAETIKRLPAGIGPFAQALETTLGTLTGMREQIERSERATARQNRLIEAQKAIVAQVQQARQRAAEAARATRDEITLLNTPEALREQVQQQQLHAAAVRRIQAQQAQDEAKIIEQRNAQYRELSSELAKLREEGQHAVSDWFAPAGTIAPSFQRRIDDVRSQMRALGVQAAEALDEIGRSSDEQVAELGKKLAAARKQLDEQVEQSRLRAVAEADSQIEQMRLRLQGRALEAELHAIETVAKARIEAAREAGNKELAERERVLADMAKRGAQAREERRQRIETEQHRFETQQQDIGERLRILRRQTQPMRLATLDQNRFLTGVREQSLAQDRSDRYHAERQIRALEEMKRQQQQQQHRELMDLLQRTPILMVEQNL